MTADVYADDLAMADGRVRTQERYGFAFHIEADADPDALFRIVGQLNLANRAPSSASLVLRDDDTLFVEVRIDALASRMGDAIMRKLAQLTCVRIVQFRAVSRESDGAASEHA